MAVSYFLDIQVDASYTNTLDSVKLCYRPCACGVGGCDGLESQDEACDKDLFDSAYGARNFVSHSPSSHFDLNLITVQCYGRLNCQNHFIVRCRQRTRLYVQYVSSRDLVQVCIPGRVQP